MNPIPLPYRILAAVGVALALLIGGYAAGHHVESLTFTAYKAEVDAASAKAVAGAEQHAAKVQDVAAQQQATTVATYQEKIDALNSSHEAARSANAGDAQRVRVAVTDCRPNAVRQAAAGTGGTDAAGGYTAQLQPEVAFSLLTVGSDADDTVGRLVAKVTALQARVKQDLIEINGAYSEEGTLPSTGGDDAVIPDGK
ncbi:hypothetical protein [Trinickia mobilis]|uniref:hypothetical protein n=1 Tax=Trinickia mobilis TaxID=2816356 RepID=UPI001A8D4661|nr:hypothetical protein [Trinickia mobilis]